MINLGAELLNRVLIRMRTTFRNVPRAGLTEFTRDNNENNIGMMAQFSDVLLMELER